MTDEVSTSTEITGVAGEVPFTDLPSEPTAPVFADIVPADYKDAPWVQDVKDIPSLFKMTGDLKSEMGKRVGGIPQADATDEQWGEFNKAFGVPEKGEGYELEAPTPAMEEFQKGLRDIYLKHDISQRQAGGFNESLIDLMESFSPDSAVSDEEFSKISKEVFGDREEEALKIAKGLLTEMQADLPESLKEVFDKLPNKQLLALAAGLDKIQSKYINADDLPRTDGASVSGAMTPEEKRAEGSRLMASPEYENMLHPGHKAVAARVRELYGT